ncbi:relaxase domain-containing protein [Acidithiobacillus ferrivorans]|nr:relaxase domain-containing protein [Acidithiobacillus ferrivorans]
MLSVKPMSSAKGSAGDVIDYLSEGEVRSDSIKYYENNKGNASSAWLGAGAELLGLGGAVDKKKLEELLDGKIGGQRLTAEGKDRRMGSDLTFSAPKSVSVVALGLNDRKIIEAHDEAVKEAMLYIEETVAKARYGKGGKTTENTGVLVSAAYRHEDARPVDGYIAPQLHTHCLVINATKDEKGWRGVDLDFGEDSVRMHTADAIYKSRLSMKLKELGYGIRQTKDGFEIDGISDEQIANFSKRKVQIDAALQEAGLTREGSTTGDRTAANLKTRSAKLKVDSDDLHIQWSKDCRAQGIDLTSLTAHAASTTQDKDGILQKSITDAIEHHTERHSVFSAESLYLTAVKNGMGTVDYEAFKSAIDSHPDIIKKQKGLITTAQAVERDAWIAGYAVHTHGKMNAFINTAYSANSQNNSAITPPLNVQTLSDGISALESEQGFKFSDGQRDAVALALSATDKVIGMVGAAGSGKTTSMRGITKIAHEQNYEVIGIAPSSAAANELKSANANGTMTIASFVLKENTSNKPRLIIVDEAGMVSAPDMRKIMEKLDSRDKLLLVGDPKQLSAVEAGSPFADLIKNKHIQYAEINEIQRQKDVNLLSIAQDFANGDTASAVAKVASYMHEVTPEKTGRDAKGKAVASTQDRRMAIASATAEKYLELDQDMRDKTLVLSGTNEVRSLVNEKIRAGLKSDGSIDSVDSSIQALKKTSMTQSESKKAHNYDAGMLVRETYNALDEEGHKVRLHRDWKIAGNNVKNEIELVADNGTTKAINASEMLKHSYKAYSVEKKSLAANDKIVILENNKELGLLNGDILTVEKIENGNIYAKDSEGLTRVIDSSKPIAMDHAYCLTIHKSQGRTVENTIVAGEASRTATAESGYVACSREKYGLTIITDNAPMLQKRWQTYADRQSAEHDRENAVDSQKLDIAYDKGMSSAFDHINPAPKVLKEEQVQTQEQELAMSHEFSL